MNCELIRHNERLARERSEMTAQRCSAGRQAKIGKEYAAGERKTYCMDLNEVL
jgi:hypothetical protein